MGIERPKTKIVTASGKTLVVYKLPPRRGFRLKHECGNVLGPILFALVGDKISIDGKAHDFREVLEDSALLVAFAREAMRHLFATQADEVLAMFGRLCAGVVYSEDGECLGETPEEAGEAWDALFVDDVEMSAFFWDLLVFQFRPTFPVRNIGELLRRGMLEY